MRVYTVKHCEPHVCHLTVWAGTSRNDAMEYAMAYVSDHDSVCHKANVMSWYGGEASIIAEINREEV